MPNPYAQELNIAVVRFIEFVEFGRARVPGNDITISYSSHSIKWQR
jgi:hypothetical protein